MRGQGSETNAKMKTPVQAPCGTLIFPLKLAHSKMGVLVNTNRLIISTAQICFAGWPWDPMTKTAGPQ